MLSSLGEDSYSLKFKGKLNFEQVWNILYSHVSSPNFVSMESKRFEHNIQLF